MTLDIMVEVCILLYVEDKKLQNFFSIKVEGWAVFLSTEQNWALCWQGERTIKDRFPVEKSNPLDFQRDVDISTFESLDQAQPFRSLTFHLKSWPQERNDGSLLNI